MAHGTLIPTAALADLLADSTAVIVDCRFELADTDAGERAYFDSHVPGAVYAHLDLDLSGVKTGLNGRHPLPDPAALVATLGRLGIAPGTQVVAYDQDSGMWASRLWNSGASSFRKLLAAHPMALPYFIRVRHHASTSVLCARVMPT